MRRRRLLVSLAATAGAAVAGCLGDDADEPTKTDPPGTTPDTTVPPDQVGLEALETDLTAPTDIAFRPGDEGAFVTTQPGRIYHVDRAGGDAEVALDLSDRVVFGGERGLLGVALHPAVEDTDRLFVRYSAPPRAGTPASYSHTFVAAEFTLNPDHRSIAPDSESTIIEIPEPQSNHNSGDVLFGPDGYLYLGSGDGGGAADAGPGHPDDWYAANAGGNGQDTREHLLGGILRLDVDHDDAPGGYAIPPDNPLVDRPEHRDEYFAWGLRNPWGAAFDEERLFVADVGQSRREEVNLVERGGNYGWNVREGTSCFSTADPFTAPDACPSETPAAVRGGERLRDPIVEYPNDAPSAGSVSGVAVCGGHVYRGEAIPGLWGRYVFADLQPEGRLFVAAPADDPSYPTDWVASTVSLTADAAEVLDRVLAIDRDHRGELYVLGGGGVFRLQPA